MEYETVSKYDRTYGAMREICMRPKQPSTVQVVEKITGRAETYIVETMRHEQEGDYIFVQCVDDKQNVTRLALPPKVAKAISSQKATLDKRSDQRAKQRRSDIARTLALQRMERGEKPAFLLKKKDTA